MSAVGLKLSFGLRLHQAGRLDDAEQCYREALRLAPGDGDALYLLGALALQADRPEEAAEHLTGAVAAGGGVDRLVRLGVALSRLGRLEEAAARYREALDRDPSYAEAHYNLAVVLSGAGDHAGAVAHYRYTLASRSGAADAENGLGVALKALGRTDEARGAFDRAIALRSDFAEAHNNLGNLLRDIGDGAAALTAFETAIAIRPDYPEAHGNLGNIHQDRADFALAVAAFDKALALKPDFPEVLFNKANALNQQALLSDAVGCYRRALALDPDNADIHNNLGNALQAGCALAEGEASYRRALALAPTFAGAHSNLIYAMNCNPAHDGQAIFAEARRWNDRHAGSVAAVRHGNEPDPDRALRVGYVSPDMRAHSVSYFFEPLIAAHDRDAIETLCYAEVPRADAVTARLRAHADIWRDTVGMSDAELARRIRDDRVDILVDLAGHTAGGRLGVFALRPAPVQIAWLGYPNTTGLDAIQYRFTDAIADPPDSEAIHSETLVRLPHGFLCYRPPQDAPDIAARQEPVTFGSFNNLSKVTAQVIACWAAILNRLPDTRLLLKSRALGDAATRQAVLDAFAGHGVAVGRIDALAWIEARGGHLGAYRPGGRGVSRHRAPSSRRRPGSQDGRRSAPQGNLRAPRSRRGLGLSDRKPGRLRSGIVSRCVHLYRRPGPDFRHRPRQGRARRVVRVFGRGHRGQRFRVARLRPLRPFQSLHRGTGRQSWFFHRAPPACSDPRGTR
jgi:predicted O-linked N-acetylglucosamine transferase (SPINDLY family)